MTDAQKSSRQAWQIIRWATIVFALAAVLVSGALMLDWAPEGLRHVASASVILSSLGGAALAFKIRTRRQRSGLQGQSGSTPADPREPLR